MENPLLKYGWFGRKTHYFRKMFQCFFFGKLVLEAVLETLLIGRDRKGDCFLFDGLLQNFMHEKSHSNWDEEDTGEATEDAEDTYHKWNWLPLFHPLVW